MLSLAVPVATAQSAFTGLWKFDSARSQMGRLPVPADLFLKVEQTATALVISAGSQEDGPFTTTVYPLDGTVGKGRIGDSTSDFRTKWEGAALLANILVSGQQNYTVMERWARSRDGKTLTIRKTVISRPGVESESTLMYQSPAANEVSAVRTPDKLSLQPRPAPDSETPAEYVVESGTKVLLRLTNSVNTKHTAPGDRIYLETVVPLFVDGRLIIPRGSIVIGTVTDSQKAGRVKGKSSLNLRFDSLTLPNGIARDFRSLPSQVDGHGSADRSEGKVQGEGNKGGDARTVGQTTAAGAGIGGLAGATSGHAGMGVGIGAAVGAAAGLAGVLGSRGPDVVLPSGTTMELLLDRDLRYTAAELQRRAQY